MLTVGVGWGEGAPRLWARLCESAALPLGPGIGAEPRALAAVVRGSPQAGHARARGRGRGRRGVERGSGAVSGLGTHPGRCGPRAAAAPRSGRRVRDRALDADRGHGSAPRRPPRLRAWRPPPGQSSPSGSAEPRRPCVSGPRSCASRGSRTGPVSRWFDSPLLARGSSPNGRADARHGWEGLMRYVVFVALAAVLLAAGWQGAEVRFLRRRRASLLVIVTSRCSAIATSARVPSIGRTCSEPTSAQGIPGFSTVRRGSGSGSDNGRSVNPPDHVRRLYADLKQVGLQRAHRGSCLRPSRRVVRVLRATAASSLSLLPASSPIVLHPVRGRLLCLG